MRRNLKKSALDRFVEKIDKTGTCWIWKGAKTPRGYGKFSLPTGTANVRYVYAHRHSYELANGPIPDGMIVCHTCDNPWCVNPDHLFVGSHQDNTDDCIRKGRLRNGTSIGEKHGRSTISQHQASDIKRLYADVRSPLEISKRTGISRGVINAVVYGKTWRHAN